MTVLGVPESGSRSEGVEVTVAEEAEVVEAAGDGTGSIHRLTQHNSHAVVYMGVLWYGVQLTIPGSAKAYYVPVNIFVDLLQPRLTQ